MVRAENVRGQNEEISSPEAKRRLELPGEQTSINSSTPDNSQLGLFVPSAILVKIAP
jgi:hypothetical protein